MKTALPIGNVACFKFEFSPLLALDNAAKDSYERIDIKDLVGSINSQHDKTFLVIRNPKYYLCYKIEVNGLKNPNVSYFA